MLYKILSCPDRSQTQLAYRVKFWPHKQLSAAAKDLIVWSKNIYIRKSDILSACDETLEHITKFNRQFKIVWAYNNVPTEQEWNGKSDGYPIKAEFRISPVVGDPIVVLSFELPSSMKLSTDWS